MGKIILGISAFYHDSAAALLIDGEIIAAAQEERFTRKKHDASFPSHAVRYVLEEAGLKLDDIDRIVFYDKPYLTFERLLETYHAYAPKGLISFFSSMPVWIKEKLFMKNMLKKEFSKIGKPKQPFFFSEHHHSHAASAFYPSPFEEAAILTIDGVGEWATTTIGQGEGNDIRILRELHFPHSLGLLYSAFTYYLGFKVNSGEYKLMGLAPYGNPHSEQFRSFKEKIEQEIVDIREDGSILLNMKYFRYATGLTMTHDKKWKALFGIERRKPESEISQPHMNLALAIQSLTEDIVMKLAQTARQLTGSKNLVMAGGVALNSVANGKLLPTGLFDNIWIQPAAGDAGGALGAALAAWYLDPANIRTTKRPDSMKGAYLGPAYDHRTIRLTLDKMNAVYDHYDDFDELCRITAKEISEGKIAGWFQGRMEFGPRALGNRSIIGDARNPKTQKVMNLHIKYREGFRPFAPGVLEDDIEEFFELETTSPYMLLVVPVKNNRRKKLPKDYNQRPLYDRLYHPRSDIPAVTHIDFSARIQSVNKHTNPHYWKLINEFKKMTGYGIIVNTSFNVRGEPIVCSPEDAFKCFMHTEMDILVIGNYLLYKNKQKKDRFTDHQQFDQD